MNLRDLFVFCFEIHSDEPSRFHLHSDIPSRDAVAESLNEAAKSVCGKTRFRIRKARKHLVLL